MGAVTITSGVLRGRKIKTPPGSATRPLLTRLRKSLADMLRPVLPGTAVLDLFGGSGAIAFELISNGAASACIVELRRQTAELICSNARNLGIAGLITCHTGDGVAEAERLGKQHRRFDVIIIAPPYGLHLHERALEAVSAAQLLQPGGTVVVQRDEKERCVPGCGALFCARSKKYGRTVFDFYTRDVI